MNIPEKINILGFNYEIIETDDKNILVDDSTLCHGYVRYNDRKIYLEKSSNEEFKKTILIHEILHAIDNITNLNQENRESLTEAQIHHLSIGLASIILNNDL